MKRPGSTVQGRRRKVARQVLPQNFEESYFFSGRLKGLTAPLPSTRLFLMEINHY